MTDGGWGRPFHEPIKMPGGKLVTLGNTGQYIAALSKAIHDRPEWLAAMEALLLVVEHGGPVMLIEIGIRRALNAGKPNPDVTPRRKRAKAYRLIR